MTDNPGFLDNLKEKAADLVEKGKETLETVKDKIDRDDDGEVMDDIKDMAENAFEKGKEGVSDLVEKAKHLVDDSKKPEEPKR